jgi:hypothetical protein
LQHEYNRQSEPKEGDEQLQAEGEQVLPREESWAEGFKQGRLMKS